MAVAEVEHNPQVVLEFYEGELMFEVEEPSMEHEENEVVSITGSARQYRNVWKTHYWK